jgi:hypothetical protein
LLIICLTMLISHPLGITLVPIMLAASLTSLRSRLLSVSLTILLILSALMAYHFHLPSSRCDGDPGIDRWLSSYSGLPLTAAEGLHRIALNLAEILRAILFSFRGARSFWFAPPIPTQLSQLMLLIDGLIIICWAGLAMETGRNYLAALKSRPWVGYPRILLSSAVAFSIMAILSIQPLIHFYRAAMICVLICLLYVLLPSRGPGRSTPWWSPARIGPYAGVLSITAFIACFLGANLASLYQLRPEQQGLSMGLLAPRAHSTQLDSAAMMLASSHEKAALESGKVKVAVDELTYFSVRPYARPFHLRYVLVAREDIGLMRKRLRKFSFWGAIAHCSWFPPSPEILRSGEVCILKVASRPDSSLTNSHNKQP